MTFELSVRRLVDSISREFAGCTGFYLRCVSKHRNHCFFCSAHARYCDELDHTYRAECVCRTGANGPAVRFAAAAVVMLLLRTERRCGGGGMLPWGVVAGTAGDRYSAGFG